MNDEFLKKIHCVVKRLPLNNLKESLTFKYQSQKFMFLIVRKDCYNPFQIYDSPVDITKLIPKVCEHLCLFVFNHPKQYKRSRKLINVEICCVKHY